MGVGDGGGTGLHAELAKDAGDVPLNGGQAEEERLGDRPVGVTGGDQAQHLQFARSQAVGERRRGSGRDWRCVGPTAT